MFFTIKKIQTLIFSIVGLQYFESCTVHIKLLTVESVKKLELGNF